ncbi:MAG: phosphoribosylamine--glycine ligase [Limnochordia bacterium]
MARGKRVLIVGGGGREHALAWALDKSPLVETIFCVPGNPGIAQIGTCLEVDGGITGLAKFAEEKEIDLTVVGPEAYLSLGIADEFQRRGLRLFGPTKAAAALETSKVFAKEFMTRHGIPTASYQVFSDYEEALAYVRKQPLPLVIKADGLAAGKGVTVAGDLAEAEAALDNMMVQGVFGEAGSTVVIETYLEGEEASVLAFCDGDNFVTMAAARDHKRAYDEDQGPNTGGMGAYCPTSIITDAMQKQVEEQIIGPALRGMAAEGRPYVGVLYAGLMITNTGPKVVEFNCRFGDPETQVILPRLRTDFYTILAKTVGGELEGTELEWDPRSAVCVILASGGYPGDYQVGYTIEGLEAAEGMEDVIIFHAGTTRRGGQILTDGGRVLGITALGNDLAHAAKRAYAACDLVQFKNCHFRRDIGRREGGIHR